jgi:hypothetical protein
MKPQSKKTAITVIHVAWAALIFAIAGGIYGFITGGPVNMAIVFTGCFTGGFIFLYICASFIELSRR